MYEIQEFLITINVDRSSELDDKGSMTDKYQHSHHTNNLFTLDMIKLSYVIRSAQYQSKCISNKPKFEADQACTLYANDRIIPNIQDDGQINNSFMLINSFYTEKKPLKIKATKDSIVKNPYFIKHPKSGNFIYQKNDQRVLVTQAKGWFDELELNFEDG